MTRTMLNEHKLPNYFWVEATNTSCYVINRVVIRTKLNKTPYELWNGKIPNIAYFKVFGCKCFILNDKYHLKKFDPKSCEGIFLGYASNSKAFRVFNKTTLKVEESIHVIFYEANPFKIEKPNEDEEINKISKQISNIELKEDNNNEVINNEIIEIDNDEENELEHEYQLPKAGK